MIKPIESTIQIHIGALRKLSAEIYCEDGIANLAMAECADAMEELLGCAVARKKANAILEKEIEDLQSRIKDLTDGLQRSALALRIDKNSQLKYYLFNLIERKGLK